MTQIQGWAEMPTPFAWRPGIPPKIWLTNDFHRFHAVFYEPDEAFGRHSGRLQGFPLAALLPITPRPVPPRLLEFGWPKPLPRRSMS